MNSPILMGHLPYFGASTDPATRRSGSRSVVRGFPFREIPDKFREESPAPCDVMVMTAGSAAATIMRHGMAATISSMARCWRVGLGCDRSRGELQTATNIVANTPTAISTHRINIASFTGIPSQARSLPLHFHQHVHRHHVVIQVCHDHDGAEDDQTSHKDAERQCQEIVGLIGCARDV